MAKKKKKIADAERKGSITHTYRIGTRTRTDVTLNDLDPRELAHLCTYPRRIGSVDVRAFEHQHDANNSSSRVRVASGHDGPGATTTTAVPHGNIPRTVRTAAAAIPSKPDPSPAATSATGARVQAARPGTPGLAAAATGTIPARVTGDPAATALATAEDPGKAERRTGATRAARPGAAARRDPRATAGPAADQGAVQETVERRRFVQDGRRRVGNVSSACQLFVVLRRTSRTQKATVQVGSQRIRGLLPNENSQSR